MITVTQRSAPSLALIKYAGTRADAYATFSLRPDGTVEQLKIMPKSDAVDFSFDFQDLTLRPTHDSAR